MPFGENKRQERRPPSARARRSSHATRHKAELRRSSEGRGRNPRGHVHAPRGKAHNNTQGPAGKRQDRTAGRTPRGRENRRHTPCPRGARQDRKGKAEGCPKGSQAGLKKIRL